MLLNSFLRLTEVAAGSWTASVCKDTLRWGYVARPRGLRDDYVFLNVRLFGAFDQCEPCESSFVFFEGGEFYRMDVGIDEIRLERLCSYEPRL
jgi:hypothetical protein